MPSVALIGGSGLYVPSMLEDVTEKEITTPYGKVIYQIGFVNKKEVVFMPRHGKKHSLPPHKINYHANIYALKKLGVKYIFANTTVGSLNKDMQVGDFVISNQLLDFSKNRSTTFFNGENNKVVHVDVTNPYCADLGSILYNCAKKQKIRCHNGGTYVCAEGPRFETAAEIKMYQLMGGDTVGMTGVPEVILAREAEMCYAGFSLVTNLAAGISKEPLSHKEVYSYMQNTKEKMTSFLKEVLSIAVNYDKDCFCLHALKDFGGFTL